MDSSDWGMPIEISPGAGAAQRYAELPERPPASRARYRRRVAAVLVVVGFGLVAAAQLLPWITVLGDTGVEGDLGPIGGREFATADGASVLLFAYDLVWLPVMVLAAMCAFARGPRQRALFAAGAGALATQITLMLPMLIKPGRVVGQASLFESGGLRADLSAGAYMAIAALLVIAGSLVLAVNGRVLPTEDDDAPRAGGYEDDGAPPAGGYPGYGGGEVRPVDMHAALAASQPYRDPAVDIDYGSAPAGPGSYGTHPQAPPSPADHTGYDTHPRQAAPPAVDHSMYIRPRAAGETHG